MALIRLEDFDVSPTQGFVPENPMVRLPEYFSPWEEVCDKLPALRKNGMTRSVIEKLPLLDHGRLSSQKEWYRAQVVLAAMANSYVWCLGEQGAAKDKNNRFPILFDFALRVRKLNSSCFDVTCKESVEPEIIKILPKCIAVPFCAVSRHTGLPPIINNFGFALCNWRQASPDSDLEIVTTFTGTKSEEGFFLAALLVEFEFGKGGALCLVEGQQAILDGDIDTLINLLTSLRNIIHNMTSAFRQIHDLVDAKEFYNVLRPFLSGWNETSVLKDGLVYEGVSTKPIKHFGGSAAQSSVFQAIDGFLGISHHTKTGEEHFLTKMRMYMPPKHRAFITAIENGPSLKDFVLEKKNSLLTEKYNDCVDAMKKYRSYHLNVVTKYITIQANKNPDNPNKILSSTDTGGSDLLPFLKKIRNETEEQRIS